MASPQITVNGRVRAIGLVAPHVMTLDWLRSQGLTGCKEGCAEGECGACSVMVARPDGPERTRWTAVNACLVPVYALDGQEVITAEGLDAGGDLHPVQHEMAARGGSQCGYCTPGFVCSMAAEFYRPDREPGPHGFDVHALSGNLCRCTGYRPIRDAASALGKVAVADPLGERRDAPAPPPVATGPRVDGGRFVRPATLDDALSLLAGNQDATVVAGCTDWGVEVNLRGERAQLVVAIDRLEELRVLEVRDDVIEIGAALTLSEIEQTLHGRVPLLAELFPLFGSRLIRNGATLGGNLGTGSPIGDATPVLLALEAQVVLAGASSTRTVELADYFTGYRASVRVPGELIRSVRIPLPLAPTTAFYKIAKRRFDDISSVAVAIAADIVRSGVRRIAIGLGGVAATPLRATRTEQVLLGEVWSRDLVDRAAQTLRTEGAPLDDHRASAAYRAAMLEQALLAFHTEHVEPLLASPAVPQ